MHYIQSNPLISIVLPTKNGSKHIRDSIESCLNQSYNNIELIIVNDASTDNTEEIVENYIQRDHRVKVLHHSKNRKLPAALNTGFKEAKGSYLTWTSDDNMYRKNALATLLSVLAKNLSVGLVYSDYSVIDGSGKILSRVLLPSSTNLCTMNVIGACFLYKREVLDRIGGYDTLRFLVEDYEYWLRIATVYQLKHISHDLYLYRKHENSLTNQHADKIKEEKDRLLLEYVDKINWLTGNMKSSTYFSLAYSAYQRTARKQALICITKFHPTCLFSMRGVKILGFVILGIIFKSSVDWIENKFFT